ncbi:MAG: hypothetical protein ACLUFN_06905 [Eubacterium sp.]
MSDETKAGENTSAGNHIDDSENKKNITVNDEIEELNKSVLGKLESPLVVHKKSDASYDENASNLEMNETHSDEERPTIARHRFKKNPKKKHKGLKLFILFAVIAAAVFAALYYTGHISFDAKQTTTKHKETTSEVTTSLEEAYQGKIVIKNTYIFVDGVEVDGVNGLQNALKYEDASPTAYEIVIEGSSDEFEDNFYNYEILPILQSMGFYDESTVVTHIESTGLMAAAETTTVQTTTTTTTVKSSSAKNNE